MVGSQLFYSTKINIICFVYLHNYWTRVKSNHLKAIGLDWINLKGYLEIIHSGLFLDFGVFKRGLVLDFRYKKRSVVDYLNHYWRIPVSICFFSTNHLFVSLQKAIGCNSTRLLLHSFQSRSQTVVSIGHSSLSLFYGGVKSIGPLIIHIHIHSYSHSPSHHSGVFYSFN